MFGARENQLELFDVTAPSTSCQASRQAAGRLRLELRYDQLALAGIAGLMIFTVVFATGVERGKQLVRTERVLLARSQPAEAETASSTEPFGGAPLRPFIRGTPSSAQKAAPAESPKGVMSPKGVTSPKAPPPNAPVSIKPKSRYAVQVVTYSRPQLAKRELERLKAAGESAFVVLRDGRTSLFVGPFPSKSHATQKLAGLKGRYQDCFVKTL